MTSDWWKEFSRYSKRSLKQGSPLSSKAWHVVVALSVLAIFMAVGAVVDERPKKKLLAFLFALAFGIPAYLLARWLRAPEPASSHRVTVNYV